jgi:hypothetical protein
MYRYRTTKVIRPNATKETLKYEVQDIKEAIRENEKIINRTKFESKRTIDKHTNQIEKLKVRLEEMETRYKNK